MAFNRSVCGSDRKAICWIGSYPSNTAAEHRRGAALLQFSARRVDAGRTGTGRWGGRFRTATDSKRAKGFPSASTGASTMSILWIVDRGSPAAGLVLVPSAGADNSVYYVERTTAFSELNATISQQLQHAVRLIRIVSHGDAGIWESGRCVDILGIHSPRSRGKLDYWNCGFKYDPLDAWFSFPATVR